MLKQSKAASAVSGAQTTTGERAASGQRWREVKGGEEASGCFSSIAGALLYWSVASSRFSCHGGATQARDKCLETCVQARRSAWDDLVQCPQQGAQQRRKTIGKVPLTWLGKKKTKH